MLFHPGDMEMRKVVIGSGRYDMALLPDVPDAQTRIAIIDGAEVEVDADTLATVPVTGDPFDLPKAANDPFAAIDMKRDRDMRRDYAADIEDVLS